MGESIPTTLARIDDRLDELRAAMTDEAIDVVTERYHAWKGATRAELEDIVVESALTRFDLARGMVDRREGRRPTPPVYLDAAASRAFLMGLKKELENDPAAVLRRPPSEAMPAPPLRGILKVVDLLERRLPKAFRGRPETERDLQEGFETLLAGAEIAYESGCDSIRYSARTYVPDFTFPDLQAALKLKLCNRPDREQELLAEINDEILAYRTRYPHVIFGVYDLGFIRDADRFREMFKAKDGVWVRVLTFPAIGAAS